MTATELRIVEKLTECHRAAKALFGDRFDDLVEPYIDILRQAQRGSGKPLMLVVSRFLERAEGMQAMMFCAAACEISYEQ